MNFIQRQLALLTVAAPSQAAIVNFEASDFSLRTTFRFVRTFSFAIDIAEPLA